MRFWRTLQRDTLQLGKYGLPTGVSVAQTHQQPTSYLRNSSAKQHSQRGRFNDLPL